MSGPHKGYTTPHRCATVNESKRHQPSDTDQQARHKLQEKATDFHANFYGPVYLSIGPDAKNDIHNIFNPDKSISIHLVLPSTERPLLVEIIKQEGKTSIYTTDFYFANKSPSNIVVLSPSQNNTTPTGDQAAATDPTLFETDLLQSGEICLLSWMLYMSCISKTACFPVNYALHSLQLWKECGQQSRKALNGYRSLNVANGLGRIRDSSCWD